MIKSFFEKSNVFYVLENYLRSIKNVFFERKKSKKTFSISKLYLSELIIEN